VPAFAFANVMLEAAEVSFVHTEPCSSETVHGVPEGRPVSVNVRVAGTEKTIWMVAFAVTTNVP